MKKTLLLAGIMLMTRFLTANADVDPNFYVYLCFGQSNMEGNAAIEAQDKEYVDPRFKTLACVDFQDPRRNKGEWYTAYPPIVRQGTGLGMADYFGRTMVANLPNEITVGVVDVRSVPAEEIEVARLHRVPDPVALDVSPALEDVLEDENAEPPHPLPEPLDAVIGVRVGNADAFHKKGNAGRIGQTADIINLVRRRVFFGNQGVRKRILQHFPYLKLGFL